jgi:hypothetical protein
MGKWCVGDVFPGAPVSLPRDRWVRVRIRMKLDPSAAGQMRVWLDEQLALDAHGITLPVGDAVFDRLQVGITANGNPVAAQTMYIDSVRTWDTDPGW